MLKKFFIVLVIIILAATLWYRFSLTAVGGIAGKRMKLQIPKGASVAEISALLSKAGVIRSPLAFRLYTRIHGLQKSLQAGTFIFTPASDVPGVLEVLHTGKSSELPVTIPEGATVKEIDAILAEKGMGVPGGLLECAKMCDFSSFQSFLPAMKGLALQRGAKLEGYLFPETYYVNADEFVPKFFLERLLGTFDKRVLQDLGADIKVSGRTTFQIVTMASLVEAETRTDDERPVVAGILWRRLDAQMPLGVDAAVRYVLDKPTDALTKQDLGGNSPYNLRKEKGLPPSAISNPGIKSIEAVLHPVDSQYWYYLHDAKGQIHYAVTNDEHNANKQKYLK